MWIVKSRLIVWVTIVLFAQGSAWANESTVIEKDNATGQLVIRVTDLSSMKGFLRIAVFNSADTWLNVSVFSNVLKLESASCSNMTCNWTIENAPYGEYGIAIYHDENGNEELDKYFFGLPKEDYGFSNNESIPPKWKNAKFVVNAASTENVISLH